MRASALLHGEFFKKKIISAVYSNIVLSLAERIGLEPAFVQLCMDKKEDGRFSRLVLFSTLINKKQMSVIEALTVPAWTPLWFELLIKASPQHKELFFIELNTSDKLLKCLNNDMTNLAKILAIFPEKEDRIFELLNVNGLEKFTQLDVNKIFQMVELFPAKKALLFQHFIAAKNFLAYTHKAPLVSIETAIKVFPDKQELIYESIAATKGSFLQFANGLSELTWLVNMFPSRKDNIFEMAIADECFNHYYHYGHFSDLHQLKILFESHYPELSHKAKDHHHIQSVLRP